MPKKTPPADAVTEPAGGEYFDWVPEAYQMRLEGDTWPTIGEKFGIGKQQAARHVHRFSNMLAELETDDGSDHRQDYIHRLLLTYQQAGDVYRRSNNNPNCQIGALKLRKEIAKDLAHVLGVDFVAPEPQYDYNLVISVRPLEGEDRIIDAEPVVIPEGGKNGSGNS